MQRTLILLCALIATSASARNLSVKRRIAYEASVRVVSFKCKINDAAGGGVRHVGGPAKGGNEGTVRKTLSFRMTVRSTVDRPVAVRAIVRFYDKDGVKLLETKHDQYKPKIGSRKTQVLQWERRLDAKTMARLHLAEIYCGDHANVRKAMSKLRGK